MRDGEWQEEHCGAPAVRSSLHKGPDNKGQDACWWIIDPEAAQVWRQLQQERLKGMTMFATDLHDKGQLRPGLSVNETRDVLWTYNSAELYQLLVLERGWSPKRYGRWIAHALIAALLPGSFTADDAPPTDPRGNGV